MTLEQCADILGPIVLHRVRDGRLTLHQRYASVEEIVQAARQRLLEQIKKGAL